VVSFSDAVFYAREFEESFCSEDSRAELECIQGKYLIESRCRIILKGFNGYELFERKVLSLA